VSVRLALALIIFGLDLWALLRVRATSLPRRQRWRWTLIIVALPVLGVLLWWRAAVRERTPLDARPEQARRSGH
jgi:hypothetical protein